MKTARFQWCAPEFESELEEYAASDDVEIEE